MNSTVNTTNMVASDFNKFSNGVATLYDALYGTPAAGVAYDIYRRFEEVQYDITDEMPEEYLGEDDSDTKLLADGRYLVRVDYNTPITEERMRRYNMDAFVDENLSKLNGMLDQFPEGTYQRAMVDYMIHGLEATRDRELCIDTQNNPLAKEMPGVSIADKIANYGFIPTIATKSIDPETGREELVFPDDLPEDEGFLQPHADQQKRKTYSKEELQKSADRINFSGFNNAGFAYSRALRENINLVSMGGPASPEEEQILAEHILESMNAAEREMRKAMDVDPGDPVAQRAFDGQEGTLNDAIFSNGRGFGGNVRSFDRYRRYIESGLPVTGFSEYDDMRVSADNLESQVGAHREYIENVDDLYKACKDFKDRINDLPPRGASAEEREAWRRGVEESMLRVVEEKKKLQGNLKLKDHSFPEITEQDPQKRAAAEKARSAEIQRWREGSSL